MNNQIKKRCTMNCGLAKGDTRTRAQMMKDCDDCDVLTERDHEFIAIERLSNAMVLKLDKKRAEGRGGWQTASAETLSQMLIEHVAKGDPVDVANFCMMLFMNGQSIVTKSTERSAIPAIFSEVNDAISMFHALKVAPDAGKTKVEALVQRTEKWDYKRTLAPDHNAMRVNYSGLLGVAVRALMRSDPCHAEMLRQMQVHLEELGQRFYEGDISVVDEFLQLYCIESDARKALKGGAA